MNWWQALTSRIRHWATALHAAVVRLVVTLRTAGHRVRRAAGQAAGRHRERAGEDTVYARSVSTAVSELVTTMVPRPWLATTLAVTLAGLLGGHHDHPQHHPSRTRETYRDYDTDPPAVPGSLWDRLQ